MSTERYQITVRKYPDGRIDVILESDYDFCNQIIKTILSQGIRRRDPLDSYKPKAISKSPSVFAIARRWVDDAQNNPLMTHSIRDEIERWRVSQNISREQITDRDRSRIRNYVLSAEQFLETKLKKHGVRFEIVGNRYNQTRKLTEPLDLTKTTLILAEAAQKEDTDEPITNQ